MAGRGRRGSEGARARPRRAGLLARWRGWQRHHSVSAAESLARILRHPVASATTWLVIGIAIALPASLWILLENAAGLTARMQTPAQISVFLAPEAALADARALAIELRDRGDVQEVVLVPKEDALAEFAARSGLGEVAMSLPDNPLPHVLLVRPSDQSLSSAEPLARDLAALPSIGEVVVDSLWLERLDRMMSLGRRAVQLLGVLLLAAVVLVLGNTIRLAIESRRDEIEVIKLVGGSDAFVRRPLLYTGLWYGLGGGCVAALLLLFGTLMLASPVAALAASYGSTFRLHGPGVVDSLQLVLVGGGLGLSGAWLAVARHLRDIEPEPL
jgi:cell division transport system permease protein